MATTDQVVRAERLGKRYQLGQLQTGYQLLSEVVSERVRSFGRRSAAREDFWALRDISFDVARGETFGIIGHNGAGKSTLLKILARVTPPTEGRLALRGRVGALLEVGTGFHAELTGRENISLNGAILGMRRAEIASKFDEIVEFAEVEQFIDTPVKRYSSGMYLRLAFSVAAHLEPEVLIVDEVLSVGDLAFQEKCLGRMEAVAGEGRTVLFVSHNLAAVSKLCPRAMLLSRGHKVTEGPTAEVIEAYVTTARKDTSGSLEDRPDRQGSGRIRLTELRLADAQGNVLDSPRTGQDFDIVLRYASADGRPVRNAVFGISVYSVLGELMLNLDSDTTGASLRELPPSGEIRCRLPRCPLPAGRYVVNVLGALGGDVADWVQRASELTVTEGDFYGTGRLPSQGHRSVLVDQSWRLADAGEAPGEPSPEPMPLRRGR
jgi:homopolymeric O-antigen transport system ATP-binding protein